ncbi:MAG TPA: hypothetical protein VHR45_22640 [Thermoanaerobaculia bacterium]|nr:hypothetical protein [Thermoanaerobaculia bacterium]
MSDWSPADLLPGIYAGALCGLLAAALRRWFDRVPGWALGAFALLPCLLFGGALFGGKVLLPLDNLRGHVPFRQLPPAQPHGNLLQGDLIELVTPSLAGAWQALGNGRWPLWNSRVGAGMPLLADPQAQALQPLALLAMPLGPLRAPGVIAALRVWLALVFTFLFLRLQRLGEGPALAGSFAFGLGGFLLLWVGWPLANSGALLPMVLYALVRCERRGGRRDALLLTLGLVALLLGGHPESVLFVLLVALAFVLALARGRPSGRRLPLLGGAGLAALLSAAAAAPALLPAVDYLPQSLRAARLHDQAREGTRAPDQNELAQRLLQVAAPNAYGNSRFAFYWGASNSNEDASGFVGTATLLAALLAVMSGLRGGRVRLPQEGLMLVVAGLCLALLARPPGVPQLLDALVPGLGESRRLLLPLGFSVAYLGACTLERLRRGETGRWQPAAAAAALAAVVVWGYLAHPDPADPARLEIFRFGWLRWQLRFLAAAALLFLGAGGPAREARRSGAVSPWRAAATFGVAALIAAELLLVHGPANPPMPRRLAFPSPPPLQFLAARLGGDRIAALGRALPPNLASLYGLADARVYNPMAPAAYAALTAPITAGWWGELPLFGAPADPLYRRLGVRFLLTGAGEPLPPPWTRVLGDPSGWLWEEREVWPRFFLTSRRDGRPQGPPLEGLAAEDDAVSLRVRPPGSESISDGERAGSRAAGAPSGERWLAGSLLQDGGWLLLAGGRPSPTGVTGGCLLAAPLPPATLRLDLLYRPRGFIAGLLLAALATAAAAALWLSPPRRPTAAAKRPSR